MNQIRVICNHPCDQPISCSRVVNVVFWGRKELNIQARCHYRTSFEVAWIIGGSAYAIDFNQTSLMKVKKFLEEKNGQHSKSEM